METLLLNSQSICYNSENREDLSEMSPRLSSPNPETEPLRFVSETEPSQKNPLSEFASDASFNFLSDDFSYDDDDDFNDFDEDFDEDFEELPDDEFEDYPDPYADDEEEELAPNDDVELDDPFDDFDDLDTDENTFINDDDDDL